MLIHKNTISILALLFLLGLMSPLLAQSIALKGVSGKKALISVNGGKLRFVKLGATIGTVTITKINNEHVSFQIGDEKFILRVGDTRANKQGAVPKTQVTPVTNNKNTSVNTALTRYGAKELTIEADLSGHYFKKGHINGQSVKFLIDTGATSIFMSGYIAKQLGIDYKKGEKVTAITASGEIPSYAIDLQEVKLGGIVQKNIRAVITDNPKPDDYNRKYLLLGMSFLSKLTMTFNEDTLLLQER